LIFVLNIGIMEKMLDRKYQNQIRDILKKGLGENARFFIFGSSLEDGKFSDVDVAIDGEISDEKSINLVRENLEESDLPYKIDLVYLKKTEKSFQDKILKGKILWLT